MISKRLVVFLGVLAFVFAACSSSVVEPTPSQTATPKGHVSGVLRTPGPDPLTLDPAMVTDAGSHLYVAQIFDGLLTMALDKDGKLIYVPDIAESIPEPVTNQDGTVSYTFRLRQDIKFHLGRQVTAKDFKYSWERVAAPETTSSTAELYLSDIVGVLDKLRGRARNISGLEVIDDFTLKVTITGPTVDFLWKLTYPTAMVVDREQVETNPRTWTKLPNGTGPFKLETYVQGQKLVLNANVDYHLGSPTLKRIEFNLQGGSTLTAYENGETDISGVGIADIDRVRDPNDPLSSQLVEASELSTSYIGFNTDRAPFDDPLMRQAMARAIDMDTIVNVVLKNVLSSAHGIVPPGMAGYTPVTSKLTYDPAEARNLLAKSKYANNMPQITLAISGQGATAGPVIEAVIEMWRQELKLEVNIEQAETTTFFENVKRGKYQMFVSGWIADYPDPADFLDLKFHSQRSVANNESRYNNPKVDALLDQARVEADPAKRSQLYQQAEAIILDDAPWIPLLHGKTMVVVAPYVHGYVPTSLGEPLYRFVTVD